MSGKYSDDEYEYESGGSDFDDDDEDGGYTYGSDDDDDGDFEMKMPHRSGDNYTVYNLDEIAARQEQVGTVAVVVSSCALPLYACCRCPSVQAPGSLVTRRVAFVGTNTRSPQSCRTCWRSHHPSAAPFFGTTSGIHRQ